jgi:hypothetical protein
MRFVAKFFEKIRFRADSPRVYAGRSVIDLETRQNGVRSGGQGGQSAAFPRTVRGPLADSPPAQQTPLTAVDFGIQKWTIREVCVFYITASNGKGEYKYSMPGLGEPLLAL